MTTFELTEKYVLGNYGRFPIAFTRGEGSWIWDESGKKYLDFGAGIAVCSLGHAPACIQEALREQSAKLIHCSNLYHIPQQAELAEFIVEKVVGLPGKVFFANSGAEANDGAVKLARKFFYDKLGKAERFEVITCQNSFHGRTLGGIAATGQEKVKIGFDPLLPGFIHVPFNDCDALRKAVTGQTAAILFEPIQGEGGIHLATPEFMQTAAELREEFGVLLMFDEIQCGLGRTGNWCGWRGVMEPGSHGVMESCHHSNIPTLQHSKTPPRHSIEPDVVTWAKGMAGGFPMGGIWISDRCAGALGPGTHGSTFGGTPLGSAVALAVLREIEASGCMERIPLLEKKIRDRVKSWDFPQIKELRGLGLMLGFVLDETAFAKDAGGTPATPTGGTPMLRPSPSPSIFLVKEMMKEGLLTVPAGPGVVRWLPPLNVSEDEIDTAFALMECVLSKLATP